MAKFESLDDIKSVNNEMPFVDRLDQRTIYGSLLKTSTRFPNRPAITFQLESGPKKSFETYSWKELLVYITLPCSNGNKVMKKHPVHIF